MAVHGLGFIHTREHSIRVQTPLFCNLSFPLFSATLALSIVYFSVFTFGFMCYGDNDVDELYDLYDWDKATWMYI